MRKCVRCESDMAENYDVKVERGAYGLRITKPGLFKNSLGNALVNKNWTQILNITSV